MADNNVSPNGGLRQMTATEQANLDAARQQMPTNAAIPKTSLNPTDAEKSEYWKQLNQQTVQPNASTSQLRSLTTTEAANINQARAEKGITSATAPQLLQNPNPTATAAETPGQQPTTGQQGQTSGQPAPAQPVEPVPTPPVTANAQQPDMQAYVDEIGKKVAGGQIALGDSLQNIWDKFKEFANQVSAFQTPRVSPDLPFGADLGLSGINNQTGQEAPIQAGVASQVQNTGQPTGTQVVQAGLPGQNTGTATAQKQAALNATDAGVTPKVSQATNAALNVVNNPASQLIQSPDATSAVKDREDAYGALLKNFMEQYANGTEQDMKTLDSYIEIINKRQESAQASAQEEAARINSGTNHNIAYLKAMSDSQVDSIEIERQKQNTKNENRLVIQRAKNARLTGALKGKFAAMGMSDSSAAMEQLDYYTSLSDLALSDAEDQAQSYSAGMLAKESEIKLQTGEQLYQLETQRADQLTKLRRDTYEQMLNLDEQRLKTESQKNQEKMQMIKDITATSMDIEKTKFQEIQQIKGQALQEAQFTFTQLQAAKQNDLAVKAFQLQVDQFNDAKKRADWQQVYQRDSQQTEATGYLYVNGSRVLDPKTGDFQRTLPGANYDLAVDQWKTGVDGFIYENGVNTGKESFDRYKYNKDYTLNERQVNVSEQNMNLAAQKQNYDQLSDMVNKGRVDASALNKYIPQEIMMDGATYYESGPGQVQTLGERLAGALKTAASQIQNGTNGTGFNYQCVQFVRSIMPDLPHGLTTLADKINTLVKNNPNSIPAPEVGAAVILDWGGQYGHIASVVGKNEAKGEFMIAQNNVPQGQVSFKTIKMNDPNIKGYWMSPKMKPGKNSTLTQDQQLDVDTIASMTTSENQRDSFLATAQKYAQQGGDALKSYTNKYQFSQLPEGTKTKIGELEAKATSLDNILAQSRNFKSEDAGMYTKFFNDQRKWLDIEKSGDYQNFVSTVFPVVAELKNSLYGANLTESELAQANLFLPSSDDKPIDVFRKVQKLRDYVRVKQAGLAPYNRDGFSLTPQGKVRVQADDGVIEVDPLQANFLQQNGVKILY